MLEAKPPPAAPKADPPPPEPAAAPAPPPAAAPPPASAPPPPASAPPVDRDELHARIAALEEQIDAAKAGHSSEQGATIRALQLRLAAFEEELQKSGPAYPRASSAGASAFRIALSVIVFVVIAGSPLFITRRSVCHDKGRQHTSWSLVKPFDSSGPRGCENDLGGTVLLDAVGIK
jgi:hypothetical protein